MIIGQYETTINQKRRLAVPKKIRQDLGKKFIVAKWYEGCLVLVSGSSWKALLDRLTGKKGIITAPVRDTDRFILGSAFEVEPDSQGRMVMPSVLTDYAQLSNEVIFLGLGDRVEIWNKKLWTEREKFVAEHAGEFVEKLAEKENGK